MDVSDIFYFSARGGGRGSPKRQECGGVGFLLEILGVGVVFQEGEGLTGREGVCGELGNFLGGGVGGEGLKILFRGRNVHQESFSLERSFLFPSRNAHFSHKMKGLGCELGMLLTLQKHRKN